MAAAELQQSEKFALVQMSAKDLSKGGLQLPSFPDIVVRTRRALADDNRTTEQFVQIIGADPVIASRARQVAWPSSGQIETADQTVTVLLRSASHFRDPTLRNSSFWSGRSISKSSKEMKTPTDNYFGRWS